MPYVTQKENTGSYYVLVAMLLNFLKSFGMLLLRFF